MPPAINVVRPDGVRNARISRHPRMVAAKGAVQTAVLSRKTSDRYGGPRTRRFVERPEMALAGTGNSFTGRAILSAGFRLWRREIRNRQRIKGVSKSTRCLPAPAGSGWKLMVSRELPRFRAYSRPISKMLRFRLRRTRDIFTATYADPWRVGAGLGGWMSPIWPDAPCSCLVFRRSPGRSGRGFRCLPACRKNCRSRSSLR